MTEPTVLMLIGSDFVGERHRALLERAPHVRVVTDPADCDPLAIDAIFTFKLPAGMAPRFPQLRLVASVGAGADGLLSAGDIPPQVAVTRVVDPALGLSMAQYVSYQLVRMFRGFDRYEQYASDHRWVRHPIPDARQHTVAIMGVGEIGRVVAAALAAQGFCVIGWSRSGKPSAGVERMYQGDAGLPDFLGQADTLVCLLPYTEHTRGVLDRRTLAQLKPGAFVINAARGGIVVEADLLALLDAGHLSGAAFDVFATEPLPDTDPMRTHPRVAVTPHIAAQPSIAAAVDQFVDNLARVRSGRTPLHAVDRAAGY